MTKTITFSVAQKIIGIAIAVVAFGWSAGLFAAGLAKATELNEAKSRISVLESRIVDIKLTLDRIENKLDRLMDK